jgi:hypothetical protein
MGSRRPVRRSSYLSRAACMLIAAALLTPSQPAPVRAASGPVVQNISPFGEDALKPKMTVDGDGNALIVWTGRRSTYYRIWARTRSRSGTLGPIQALSPRGGDAIYPEVAGDAAGNAVAVWYRYDGEASRVQIRARSSSGKLSRGQTLSAPGRNAFLPEVAIDRHGNALVVWYRSVWTPSGENIRVQARFRAASGALGRILTLSAPGADAMRPELAMDADGNATIVWQRQDGVAWRIEAVTRFASGRFGPVQTLSPDRGSSDYPQLALDSRGRALVVWQHYNGTDLRIQLRRRSPTGKRSRVQVLSPAGHNSTQAAVAVDHLDRALVAWELAQTNGHGIRVQVRRRSEAGRFSRRQVLSDFDRIAYDPQIVFDPGANAVITWSYLDLSTSSWRIQARRRSATGELGPVLTLSAGGNAFSAQPAVLPRRNLLVVWDRDNGGDTIYRVQCAFIDAQLL